MLLRFRCKNFRSIREEQELSLIAAKTRTDEKSESLIDTPIEDLKLLRCAALYGANASGKSNILKALAAFRRIVSNSWRSWKPQGPIPEYNPFALDNMTISSPSEFEITFLLDERLYRYGFTFDKRIFHHEWLVDITRNERRFFERTTNDEDTKVEFPGRNLSDLRILSGVEKTVRPNSLFLSATAQANHPFLSRIYAALSDNFLPVSNTDISPRRDFTASFFQREKRHDQIVSMMKFADEGIGDLEVAEKEMSETDKKTLQVYIKSLTEVDPEKYSDLAPDFSTFPSSPEVRISHRGSSNEYFFLQDGEESDGTRAFFSMLGPLLNSIDEQKVVLIDELESSLHPKLARELVRIFNSPELNPKGAQFIFTTHNPILLDLNLLRRDQIWFTEKTREGTTKLYPLTDFQPRTNQNIELGYLGGRFGAVPYLDDQLLRDSLVPTKSSQASLQFTSEEK